MIFINKRPKILTYKLLMTLSNLNHKLIKILYLPHFFIKVLESKSL